MSRSRFTVLSLLLCVGGCADAFDVGVELTPSRLRSAEPTLGERFAACAGDPRVAAGRLSREVCAGAGTLFRPPLEVRGLPGDRGHPAERETTAGVAFASDLFEVRACHAPFIAPRREGSLMF
jgi:hypothetical protein